MAVIMSAGVEVAVPRCVDCCRAGVASTLFLVDFL